MKATMTVDFWLTVRYDLWTVQNSIFLSHSPYSSMSRQTVKQGRGEHRGEAWHLPSEEEEVIFKCCCWWQPCGTPAPKAWRRWRREAEGRGSPAAGSCRGSSSSRPQLRRQTCSRRRRSTRRRDFGADLAIWPANGACGLERADGSWWAGSCSVSSIYQKPNGPPHQPTTGRGP